MLGHSFPTRRSSDLARLLLFVGLLELENFLLADVHELLVTLGPVPSPNFSPSVCFMFFPSNSLSCELRYDVLINGVENNILLSRSLCQLSAVWPGAPQSCAFDWYYFRVVGCSVAVRLITYEELVRKRWVGLQKWVMLATPRDTATCSRHAFPSWPLIPQIFVCD